MEKEANDNEGIPIGDNYYAFRSRGDGFLIEHTQTNYFFQGNARTTRTISEMTYCDMRMPRKATCCDIFNELVMIIHGKESRRHENIRDIH